VKKGVLPPPDQIINNREYWWESTLEAHERARIAEKSTAETA
jgi:hypothetical protein